MSETPSNIVNIPSVKRRFDTETYSQVKTVFYSIQYKNGWLATSDLVDMFTQSIKFYYTFYYHV